MPVILRLSGNNLDCGSQICWILYSDNVREPTNGDFEQYNNYNAIFRDGEDDDRYLRPAICSTPSHLSGRILFDLKPDEVQGCVGMFY